MTDYRTPSYRITQKPSVNPPASLRIVALKCVGCGAALEVRPDMEYFACAYCGISQVVERSGGAIALKRVGEAIRRVQRGTDRTAAELALPRLQRELNELEGERTRLLAAAVEGLPTKTNWSGGWLKLGYYTLLWFAGVMFFSNHRSWALAGVVAWVLCWLIDAKSEPERVLTAEGSKELQRRHLKIEETISSKRTRLKAQIGAERAVLDDPNR